MRYATAIISSFAVPPPFDIGLLFDPVIQPCLAYVKNSFSPPPPQKKKTKERGCIECVVSYMLF